MAETRPNGTDPDTKETLEQRKSEATSKETLGDLEETGKVADSSGNQTIASPDGNVDNGRNDRTDSSETSTPNRN